MRYEFNEIEEKWKKKWKEEKPFRADNRSEKPKYYVLDMFPYPSGAGLHVGHPLGYIASDIVARYKRLKGYNVLHPMGYDSFGLPAEQYAIQTGQHPAVTTAENIRRYRQQLDDLGFSFDWDREVKTSDPAYYRWTQWIFIQLFNSWYNKETDKAEPIETLIRKFEKEGNSKVKAATDERKVFSAEEWKNKTEEEKEFVLKRYRLTYLSDSVVNWCPALGTVLANDEVKDGVSERGGHPVIQKKMKQWSMRITAYAERLLNDLEELEWSDSIKDIQRNWIGKSTGAKIFFEVEGNTEKIEVFSTRPDTIFGATFMVLAPEHKMVPSLITEEQRQEAEAYIERTSRRSERDRMADTKSVSGAFTGTYALHPFNGKKIPIWIADYVLAGYGTGAVMAVPAGDQRDWDFARKFGLDIIPVVEGGNVEEGANEAKEGKMINSAFLDGLEVEAAINLAIDKLREKGIGERKVNYRLRDAIFSRQRYWGEPIPVYYKGDIPYVMNEDQLPLELPEVDKYLPTEDGEPPLARAKDWKTAEGYPLETNTMPGWAGSSWYLYRYMDAQNDRAPFSQEAVDYWRNVDLYIGGAEHGTGHLLYVRFWNKFLFDRGWIPEKEPFKKMINQGMIQGKSKFMYRLLKTNTFISKNLFYRLVEKDFENNSELAELHARNSTTEANDKTPARLIYQALHVDINMVDNDVLNIEEYRQWRPEDKDVNFVLEEGKFICGEEVEKMSKSKFNVVNPDDLVARYGADSLRCYEMFMGPLEQHKPWEIKGIEGVHRFLKKFWRLFHSEEAFRISDEQPEKAPMKVLHKTIKKISEDIERYSFNTVVSELMICTNELTDLQCNHRSVLEPLVVLLAPYAPFMAEELWEKLGHPGGISYATFPEYDEKYLVEDAHNYPVSFNGKMRFTLELPVSLTKEEIEKEVLAHENSQKWLEGKQPKKVIVVPNKIVNVVV